MYIPKHLLDKRLYVLDGIKDKNEFEKRNNPNTPKKDMMHLVRIEDMIHKYSPYMACYDVFRTQSLDSDEFTYTEIFKNAIYLTSQCSELGFKMVMKALETYNGDLKKDTKTLLKWINTGDKYELDNVVARPNDFPSVMFLPGSNALEATVDVFEITKWLWLDSKCVIKPHPLTNLEHLRYIAKIFNKSRIFPMEMSGADLLNQASRVYSTSMSELGLIAKLLDKEVIDITNFLRAADSTYSPLYRMLNYPYNESKDNLVKVLMNPEWSGVFFHQDKNVEEHIKNYMKNYIALQETQVSKSNEDLMFNVTFPMRKDFTITEWMDDERKVVGYARPKPTMPTKD